MKNHITQVLYMLPVLLAGLGTAAVYGLDMPAELKAGRAASAQIATMMHLAPNTLKNLMEAFNGKLNSQDMYSACALKADQEGYKKAAQLFRAAAKSNEIHARLHARAIVWLGAQPSGNIVIHTAKSTRESLKYAIIECSARLKAYTIFFNQAKVENVKGAMISMSAAIKVDAGHRILFEEALENLEEWKDESEGFYVCQQCGDLVGSANFMTCPVCKGPLSEFALLR